MGQRLTTLIEGAAGIAKAVTHGLAETGAVAARTADDVALATVEARVPHTAGLVVGERVIEPRLASTVGELVARVIKNPETAGAVTRAITPAAGFTASVAGHTLERLMPGSRIVTAAAQGIEGSGVGVVAGTADDAARGLSEGIADRLRTFWASRHVV